MHYSIYDNIDWPYNQKRKKLHSYYLLKFMNFIVQETDMCSTI